TEVWTVHDRNTLVRTLEEHIGSTKEQWGYKKEEKRELAIAALASLVLISAVWFSFTRGQERLVTFDIPVEYVNRNPATEIVDSSVNAVHVGLSGSGTLIKSIRPDQVKVRLDLSKAAVGRNSFVITSDDIGLPPGVVLRKVKPSTVEVTLDIPGEKLLPVQVDWVGRLRKDLILTSAKVFPAKVKIKGGKTILDRLFTLYTEKVRLDQIERSGSFEVKLALEPATLKIAAGSGDSVTVDYFVKKRTSSLPAR
ncbi:MAG: YbbR-like domain-containing protein, partial [Deltaproteobacteria bacterium]|nr:YbbR-like domain-containing protein [Deltaproteobacteria bacterium]